MMLDAGYWMLDIRRALAMPIVGIRLFLFAMIIFYPLVNPALAARNSRWPTP